VLLGLSGWLGLTTAVIWLGMAVVFRYSSLASITAALAAPVVYVLADGSLWFMSSAVAVSVSVMTLFLLYRHVENINRLIKGTESRLGKKSSTGAHAPQPVRAPAKHGHRHPPHADEKTNNTHKRP
jgi:glycerol-3-phosphate acyltransferase PlsY